MPFRTKHYTMRTLIRLAFVAAVVAVLNFELARGSPTEELQTLFRDPKPFLRCVKRHPGRLASPQDEQYLEALVEFLRAFSDYPNTDAKTFLTQLGNFAVNVVGRDYDIRSVSTVFGTLVYCIQQGTIEPSELARDVESLIRLLVHQKSVDIKADSELFHELVQDDVTYEVYSDSLVYEAYDNVVDPSVAVVPDFL